MKRFMILFRSLQAFFLAIIFFSCSSPPESIVEEDEFFEPVGKVVRKKAESEPAPTIVKRELYPSREDEGAKEAIMEMLQEQNRQMDSVVYQLNLLTRKELADTLKSAESLSGLLATRDSITNEMLFAMIRDQNQRLNYITEQIKTFSRNQQKKQNQGFFSLTHSDEKPLQLLPVLADSSAIDLDALLSYGKAIQLYQHQRYGKAINSFKDLLRGGVDITLQDNCHFWMGVCYFSLNSINRAISEFKNVLNIAGSDKIEGTYFMLGQCYERMGTKKLAKGMFEKILQEYPQGSLKQMTEIKLALLK